MQRGFGIAKKSRAFSRLINSSMIRLNPFKPFAWDSNQTKWVRATELPELKSLQKPFSKAQDLHLYTWNVDFVADHTEGRMIAALDHIQHLLSSPLNPTVILLQEVDRDSLQGVLKHPFVRQSFQVTNITPFHSYFTISLVSTDLQVDHVGRVVFKNTIMGRDVLYVDILIKEGGVLRFANTHLESLPIGEPHRPIQLSIISQLLKENGVIAGIVGGDMNAIGTTDIDLHKTKNIELNDVWELEKETRKCSEEEGFTWGYQPRCQFPPRRLDKLLYIGPLSFGEKEGKILTRLGVGLKYDSRDDKWVSDHFGLAVKLRLK